MGQWLKGDAWEKIKMTLVGCSVVGFGGLFVYAETHVRTRAIEEVKARAAQQQTAYSSSRRPVQTAKQQLPTASWSVGRGNSMPCYKNVYLRYPSRPTKLQVYSRGTELYCMAFMSESASDYGSYRSSNYCWPKDEAPAKLIAQAGKGFTTPDEVQSKLYLLLDSKDNITGGVADFVRLGTSCILDDAGLTLGCWTTEKSPEIVNRYRAGGVPVGE